jgi:hypothetical protein
VGHESLVFLAAGALLLALLYARAIKAPFVYDDLAQIVHNPNLAPWSIFAKRFLAAPVAFTNDLGGAASGSTYRPLFWLSIAIDYRLHGVHPLGFHVTNLLLHLLDGFLGFCLLRRVQVWPLQSAAASLLWLALPINTEVVAWISARSYELCGVFLLLALLSALAYRRSGALWLPPLYLLASLAAMLSHELGVLCLPFTVLVFFSGEEAPPRKRLATVVGAGLAADALYLVLKSLAGAASAWHPSLNWASAAEFCDYIGWIVLPIRMSVERSTSMPANQPSLYAAAALFSVFAIIAACFLLRRRLPRIAAGMVWTTLALLPFCAVSLYQGMAERFAYIASAGFAFALVTLIASLIAAFRAPAKPILLSAFSAFFIWSALRTASRAADWHDPVSLYSSSLNANPNSPDVSPATSPSPCARKATSRGRKKSTGIRSSSIAPSLTPLPAWARCTCSVGVSTTPNGSLFAPSPSRRQTAVPTPTWVSFSPRRTDRSTPPACSGRPSTIRRPTPLPTSTLPS